MIPATRPTRRVAIAPTYATVEITLFVTVVVAVVVLTAVVVAVVVAVVLAVLVSVDVTVMGGDVTVVDVAPGAFGENWTVTQVEMLLDMSWSCISVQPAGAGTPGGWGVLRP